MSTTINIMCLFYTVIKIIRLMHARTHSGKCVSTYWSLSLQANNLAGSIQRRRYRVTAKRLHNLSFGLLGVPIYLKYNWDPVSPGTASVQINYGVSSKLAYSLQLRFPQIHWTYMHIDSCSLIAINSPSNNGEYCCLSCFLHCVKSLMEEPAIELLQAAKKL